MKISELIDGIRKRDVVLPEFQREYIWTREQSKQLMVSLVNGYPVGSLLFWKTDQPPELKNLEAAPEKLGRLQVTLDGQQRLTTLYMFITSEIPPYYTERDIQTDPRNLYYNLDTGEFQYYQSSRMKGNPLWWSVIECFNNPHINVFEIAQEQAATGEEAFQLAQCYNEHLNQLRQVREIDLPVQMVPSYAELDDAIEIFDRVNSQGTKLKDAELALTHVTSKWAQARRVMKAKIEDLDRRHFYFDLTFMTRALTGVVVKRALYHTIRGRPRDELVEGWKQLERILDYLVTVLPQQAFVHSTYDLNTTNVLVPPIVYLSLNDGRFPSEQALKRAVRWLYAAHTWARYTAQTDQRLEHDVSLVVRELDPWDALCDQIIDQRGRIEVKASDLEGRGSGHPLYRMTFVIAKAHGAVDWFNGVPLGTTHGQAYRVHSHHIFPTSILYRSGYDSESHLHRKIVNEIANRAFLTAETNLQLANKPPEVYLPQVEEKYPGALVKQFIPMDPELWKVERYPDFLEARRQLIAQRINDFMEGLITEPEIVHRRPVAELVSLGESATLEFKSTLQWDVVQNQVNKQLRFSVLKTIAAFLNTAGGTLVIGVEDDGHVLGLARDLQILQGSQDRFEQTLMNLVCDRIGAEFGPFIKVRFEEIDGQTVCVVDVDRAPEPAFMDGPRGKEFFTRLGNTTRTLDPEEAVRYVQMNWE
ncbi:MAG: DUF262 domain-containing protein [Anaerolineales bacterium]|nr:MAG: DUF262 domain-containing protein [Anaerolineales bacterium]